MKRDEWQALEQRLTWPGAQARLVCDGYEVTLEVQRVKLRMVIAVFVGGWMRGEWMLKDCEERRRFMRPLVIRPKPFTKAQIRLLGKKWCEEQIAKRTGTYYIPYWPSVTALRRHFQKHNTSIERVTREGSAETQGSAA